MRPSKRARYADGDGLDYDGDGDGDGDGVESILFGPRRGLNQIHSITELAASLHRLELPSNMSRAISNRMLQHVMATSPSPHTRDRLQHWLQYHLHDIMGTGNAMAMDKNTRILKFLAPLTAFLQV